MRAVKLKKNKDWIKRQQKDPYCQKAQAQQLRSRAAFKLEQIQSKEKLIKPGMCVLELGAAPGGWSLVLKKWVGEHGRVIAIDMLPIEPIAGVDIIQGDCTTEETLVALLKLLNGQQVDVICSDMAPNLSGISSIDQPRMLYLLQIVFDLAEQVLKNNGHIIVKIFHGQGFDSFLSNMRQNFSAVHVRKPLASRAKSKEVYLVARDFKRTGDES